MSVPSDITTITSPPGKPSSVFSSAFSLSYIIYSFLPLLLPTGEAGTEQIVQRGVVGLLVLLLLGHDGRSLRGGLGGGGLLGLLGGLFGGNLRRQRGLVVGVAAFLGPLL